MEVLALGIKEMPEKDMSEIYQSVEMKFAFLSEKDEQVYVFAKCRDFLHDIVRCTITGKPMSLYGCQYDPNVHPKVDMNKMRMMVRSETVSGNKRIAEQDEVMDCSLALIHHYEAMAELDERTTVARLATSRKGSTWLFTGPSWWLSSPFFVSLYSFLIRLGAKRFKFTDNEDLKAQFKIAMNDSDNDSNYLRSAWDKIDIIVKNHRLVKNGMKLDASYLKSSIDISPFHNNGGIVSLSGCTSFSKIKNERMKALFDGKPIPEKKKKVKKEVVDA